MKAVLKNQCTSEPHPADGGPKLGGLAPLCSEFTQAPGAINQQQPLVVAAKTAINAGLLSINSKIGDGAWG